MPRGDSRFWTAAREAQLKAEVRRFNRSRANMIKALEAQGIPNAEGIVPPKATVKGIREEVGTDVNRFRRIVGYKGDRYRRPSRLQRLSTPQGKALFAASDDMTTTKWAERERGISARRLRRKAKRIVAGIAEGRRDLIRAIAGEGSYEAVSQLARLTGIGEADVEEIAPILSVSEKGHVFDTITGEVLVDAPEETNPELRGIEPKWEDEFSFVELDAMEASVELDRYIENYRRAIEDYWVLDDASKRDVLDAIDRMRVSDPYMLDERLRIGDDEFNIEYAYSDTTAGMGKVSAYFGSAAARQARIHDWWTGMS